MSLRRALSGIRAAAAPPSGPTPPLSDTFSDIGVSTNRALNGTHSSPKRQATDPNNPGGWEYTIDDAAPARSDQDHWWIHHDGTNAGVALRPTGTGDERPSSGNWPQSEFLPDVFAADRWFEARHDARGPSYFGVILRWESRDDFLMFYHGWSVYQSLIGYVGGVETTFVDFANSNLRDALLRFEVSGYPDPQVNVYRDNVLWGSSPYTCTGAPAAGLMGWGRRPTDAVNQAHSVPAWTNVRFGNLPYTP